jgi:gliding motility-associated-like protein
MKKLTILIASALMLCNSNLMGQQNTFRIDYDLALLEIPNASALALTNGNHVFTGFHTNFFPIVSSLTEVDAVGNVLWTKRYSGGISYVIGDVKTDTDLNRYYACGGSESGPAFLLFLDNNGNYINGRNFSISEADGAFFNRVIKTTDGGYLCVGYVTGYDPDGAGPEIKFSPVTHNPPECSSSETEVIGSPLIVKFDAAGNHLWHHVFRYYFTSAIPANRIYNDASFVDVTEVNDGYIAVGSYDVNNVFSRYNTDSNSNNCGDDTTPTDAMMLKVTTGGSIVYHIQIDTPNSSSTQPSKTFDSASKTSTNQALIGGSDGSGRPCLLMRVANSGGWTGSPQWIRKYAGAAITFLGVPTGDYYPLLPSRFFETSDGNYAAWLNYFPTVTISGFPFPVPSVALMKINPATNGVLFSKYNEFNLAAFFPHGSQSLDGGYHAITYILDGGGHNMQFLKTDANGDMPGSCPSVSFSTSNEAPSYTYATPIYNSWNGNTVSNGTNTPTITSPTPNSSVICLATVCTPPPLATTVTATPNPICAGQSTSITASGPGSNVSYNVYTAPTGGTNLGATPVSVSPGTTTTYYVETVDNSDPTCVSTSRVPVTVTVNPSPVANPQSNSPICVGQTLNLTTDAVSGGTYAWSGPNGFNSTDQNPTIPNAQLVNGGTYELTVTAAGCSTGPIPITVIVAETPTSSPSATNTAVCAGQTIELIGNTVTGGSYAWSGPNGFNSSDQNPTIPNASAANAGTYNLVISVGTCSSTSNSVSITVNPSPTATASNDGPVCEGNTITLTATGGTNFTWTGPNGFNATGSPATVPNATPANGGVYEVTVTDGNGCTATAQTTVTITNGASLSISGTDVACNGGTNGSATVTPTGNGPFTYSWSPSGGNAQTANGLAPGSYTVSVTDNDGCTSSSSITIGEPDALALSTSSTVSQCTVNDGSATVNVTGGTAPYTYAWSSGGTAATEPNLGPGIYTVVVTDFNGCQAQSSVTVESLNGPSLSVVNTTNVSCFGANDGAGEVLASGGTAPYTYAWSPTGGSNAAATGLGPNTYTVTVTDDAGCQAFVQVTITEPAALTATVNATNSNCGISDGSISVSVSGGTPSYSYVWTPNVGNTASVSNLAAGSYSVEITDNAGCSIVVNQTITTTGTIPMDVIPALTTIEAGDNVQLQVVLPAGVTGATYTWTPPTGLSCTNCPNPIATPGQTTTYYVTVTTPDGCVATDSAIVIVNQPCGELFVPTIFSPNGDGNNDSFCVYGSCFTNYNLTIFSRWGEKVFETSTPGECWDGSFRDKPMNSGVFVYKLIYRQIGDTEDQLESGNINLVR